MAVISHRQLSYTLQRCDGATVETLTDSVGLRKLGSMGSPRSSKFHCLNMEGIGGFV